MYLLIHAHAVTLSNLVSFLDILVEKQLNKYQGKYKRRAVRLAEENEALRQELKALAVLLSTKQQEADWVQNGIVMASCGHSAVVWATLCMCLAFARRPLPTSITWKASPKW